MNNKKTNETTLTHLTKRFVRLLNSNSERVINLNEASSRLSVAKRRIYDITNVLEGIGLLQKTSKNVTRWVDCPRDSPFAAINQTSKQSNPNYLDETPDSNNPAIGNPELADIKPDLATLKLQIPGINLSGLPDAELLNLVKTYHKLDEGIQQLESSIRQQMSVEGAYVTYHDFKSSFNDQTIIAVKAPPETWLEVNEHQQIAIKSEPGQKIEVYLYQNSTNSNNTNNQLSGANSVPQQQQQPQQQQLQHVYQASVGAQLPPHHLQQSQPSNSTNTQPLDATFTNTNNLIQQPQTYTSVSSDEGRGRSTMSTTDVTYHDPTSGASETDHYYNDPTLSSALSGTISEDEDPFKPLVPFDGREEPHYNMIFNDDFPIASMFPEDNIGLNLS